MDGWPVRGGGPGRQNYRPEQPVDPSARLSSELVAPVWGDRHRGSVDLVAAEGVVLVFVPDSDRLVAVDATTGEQLWTRAVAPSNGHGSVRPAVAIASDDKVFLVTGQRVRLLDLFSGTSLPGGASQPGTHPPDDGTFCPSNAVVVDDTLFVPIRHDDLGAELAALSSSARGSEWLCDDVPDGGEAIRTLGDAGRIVAGVHNSVSEGSKFAAVDRETGAPQFDPPARVDGRISRGVLGEETLYWIVERDDGYHVEARPLAAPERVVWNPPVQNSVNDVALGDEHLYLVTAGGVVQYDRATRRRNRRPTTSLSPQHCVAFRDHVAIVGPPDVESLDAEVTVTVLAADDLSRVDQTTVPGTLRGAPILVGGRLAVPTTETLALLSVTTGPDRSTGADDRRRNPRSALSGPPPTPRSDSGGDLSYDDIDGTEADRTPPPRTTEVRFPDGDDGVSHGVLKQSPPGRADEDTETDIGREAYIWDALDDHPNVVDTVAWDTDPHPWLLVEHVEGGSLAERSFDDISADETLRIGENVADALVYAHDYGVVHLGLEPDDVVLQPVPDNELAVPQIGDWGVARTRIDHSGTVSGFSRSYGAPEQLDPDRFGPQDDRTDLYRLGVVLYELLTGRLPFPERGTRSTPDSLEATPTPPTEIDPSLPSRLDLVIDKLLKPAPSERYERAETVRDVLRSIRTGDAVERPITRGDYGDLLAYKFESIPKPDDAGEVNVAYVTTLADLIEHEVEAAAQPSEPLGHLRELRRRFEKLDGDDDLLDELENHITQLQNVDKLDEDRCDRVVTTVHLIRKACVRRAS